YTTEYYPATGSATWHTRIGSFKFGPCPAVPKGILSGTITSSAGGVPINNATVNANGYIRQSNASGVYSVDPIGSSTYAVTVSAPGYVSKTIPGVTITTGNTTTLNVQLDPQNVLQGGTPVITNESCAPANLALDPGETVTINLPIANNGGAGATTSNLVATLQATGGVSSPSGPQTYGAVAQGSPAVVKSFTFTVSASCGQTVSITLQLQHGATNYGDAAANSISTGAPPFAGTFKPETPLSAMNGKSITGTWKLRVTDSAALDTGTVGCVTLDFMKQPYICCGFAGTPIIGSGGAATITAESIAPANNA